MTAVLRGHEQEVCGLKWSPSGTQLASGGNDNLLHIWSAAGGAPTHRCAPVHADKRSQVVAHMQEAMHASLLQLSVTLVEDASQDCM